MATTTPQQTVMAMSGSDRDYAMEIEHGRNEILKVLEQMRHCAEAMKPTVRDGVLYPTSEITRIDWRCLLEKLSLEIDSVRTLKEYQDEQRLLKIEKMLSELSSK